MSTRWPWRSRSASIAIAGVFLAIRTNFDPAIGPARLIFAFEAVIIGGLGSLWGTLAGGIILGVAQAIGAQINPGWQMLAGHLAFLAILAIRPKGLFPRMRGMSACLSRRALPRGRAASDSPSSPIVLVALAAAPFWGGRDRPAAALARSTPISRSPAFGTCSPAMPGSSRSASRPTSGSAATCCSPRPSWSACIRSSACRSPASLRPHGAADALRLIFRLRGAYFAIGTWVVAEVFRLSRRRCPRSAAAPA